MKTKVLSFGLLIALGLSIALVSSCKKENVEPNVNQKFSNEFDINDWIVIKKDVKMDGALGDLMVSKYDEKQKLFKVKEVFTKALPVTGTYSKALILPDPTDPTVVAIVHICAGDPKDCYFDDNGNLVVIEAHALK